MDNLLVFGETRLEFAVIHEGLVRIEIKDEIENKKITMELTDFEFGQLIGSFNMLMNQ